MRCLMFKSHHAAQQNLKHRAMVSGVSSVASASLAALYLFWAARHVP